MTGIDYKVTLSNNKKLSASLFIPETCPSFAVQILVGLAERKERYMPTFEYITSYGGAVIIHDPEGQGEEAYLHKTQGLLGDFGYNYDSLCTEIDSVYSTAMFFVREEFFPTGEEYDKPRKLPPNFDFELPRFLLGFSMGAMKAAIYASKYGSQLYGLILAGLPHKERFVSPALAALDFARFFLGDGFVSKKLSRIANTRYNGDFSAEESESEEFLWLSVDKKNIRRFEEDPVCNYPHPLHELCTVMRFVKDLYTPALWDCESPDLPILLMSGKEDPVSGGPEKLAKSAEYLFDMGQLDIEVKTYKGMRHEIFHDSQNNIPLSDVVDFCTEHLFTEDDDG